MKTLPSKFFIRVPSEKMNEVVQKRLFSLGISWTGNHQSIEPWTYGEKHVIYFRYWDKPVLHYGDCRETGGEEVTLDQLNLHYASL